MSDTVIRLENVSKLYRLGETGTGTIGQDVNRWYAKMRGKEDPFAQVGEVNDRTVKSSCDIVWALKDINFEVKQGEVLGIIGRNGAGKSTLLKLLSKVTVPTTGSIKFKGRIASLLEVGTGFHPDLTGRENVFLNGAILGMTKKEIKKKFDEIVDFSGVERYIDTPVKRYSSGMYVRLAFAVAAFLEPEILIVDEVLAVGDAEFQKKCLGRMQDVSRNGRTILFVSHNLSSVRQLCQKGLYFRYGEIVNAGNVNEVLDSYLRDKPIKIGTDIELNTFLDNVGTKHAYLTRIVFNEGRDVIYGMPLKVDVHFRIIKPVEKLAAAFAITNIDGARVATYDSDLTTDAPVYFDSHKPCNGVISFFIDKTFLQPTLYNIDIGLRNSLLNVYDYLGSCCTIEVKANEDTPMILNALKGLGSLRQPTKVQSSFT